MKATASRDLLANAAQWVARAIDPRSSAPDMLGMQISVGADGIELSASSYDSSHRCRIPASVGEPGNALVPGLALTPFLAALRAAEVEVSLDGTSVLVQAGSARSRLRQLSGHYSRLPLTEGVEAVTVDAAQLAGVLGRLQPVTSRNSVDPWQRAFHLMTADGQLQVTVATLCTLGRAALACEPGGALDAIVDARTLVRAVQELSGPLSLQVVDGSLVAATSDRVATVRLYDNKWPNNVDGVLNPQHRSSISLDRDDLASALKLAATATDRVRLDFQTDSLTVSSYRPERGEARSEITDVIPCDASEPASVIAALEYLGPIVHGLTDQAIELAVPTKGLSLAVRDSGARFVFQTIKEY